MKAGIIKVILSICVLGATLTGCGSDTIEERRNTLKEFEEAHKEDAERLAEEEEQRKADASDTPYATEEEEAEASDSETTNTAEETEEVEEPEDVDHESPEQNIEGIVDLSNVSKCLKDMIVQDGEVKLETIPLTEDVYEFIVMGNFIKADSVDDIVTLRNGVSTDGVYFEQIIINGQAYMVYITIDEVNIINKLTFKRLEGY